MYSNLDPSARKINTARFTHNQVNVLVVTDIAARGIDIPSLDFVINFHFPGKPKLFIHRVGRCARAGRSGTAYSIFSTDDEAHMLDLHLFLNRPFDAKNSQSVGICPPELVEEEQQVVLRQLNDSDISNIYRVSNNAYKAYIQTRPAASVESNKKVKNIKFSSLRTLEEFRSKGDKKMEVEEGGVDPEEFKANLLDQMKQYKAKTTIFELNPKLNSQQFLVMTNKRKVHEEKIEKFHQKQEELAKESQVIQRSDDDDYSNDDGGEDPGENKRRRKKKKKKTKALEPSEARDKEFYIPYEPTDKVTEDGFAINSFSRDAQKAEFTVAGDTNESQRMNRTLQRWDRKKKKMVNVEDPRAGKIRTEHGVWIAASYKTDRYAKWKERSKIDEHVEREADSDDEELKPQMRKSHPHTHWGRHNAKVDHMKRIDPELKNKEQLMKQRLRKERLQSREVASKQRNDQKRKRAMSKKAGKPKTKG